MLATTAQRKSFSVFLFTISVVNLLINPTLMAKSLFLGGSWAGRPAAAQTLEATCPASWVANEGIGGTTAYEWSTGSLLENALEDNIDAKTVWIIMGGNDLTIPKDACNSGSVNLVAGYMRDVVTRVAEQLPTASILLISYPQHPCMEDEVTKCPVATFLEYASQLQSIANDFASVTFVDTLSLFGGSVDEPSDPSYWSGCTHLNEAGYERLWQEQSVFQAICPEDDGSTQPPSPGGGGGGGGGKKRSSRRRLQSTASKSFSPGDKTYQAYLTACGHFEYPLFLHVDKNSHLLVYGVPPDQAKAAGCPFGAANSIFVTRQGKPVAQKEILMWRNADEGISMFTEEESLSIGTFKLAELAEAYEATPDDADGSSVYDLVANNCATYMVKIASTLGVKIDSRITSFVAKRLLEESGKDLADKIRNSIHYFQFFVGRSHLRPAGEATSETTDQEVVEALVNGGASGAFSDE